MKVEEFLDWHDGTDTRHMLVDGVIEAQPISTARHGLILGNAVFAVHQRLRPPCAVLVRPGLQLSADTCVLVDLAVTCEREGPSRLMERPVLLVEVLSPSTRRDDLGLKVPAYQEIASAREIWLIDSETRSVRVWRRTGDEWVQPLPVRAGSFRSAVLDDDIAVDDLYALSGL